MSQVEEIVPGTEGTEYEGLSEEEVERAEFDKVVAEDPDINDEPAAEEPAAEEPVVVAEEEEQKAPTGLEWLDELPEEARAQASSFIEQAGQANARLEQRVKSHLGQLQPAQRAITQYTRRIRELEEQAAKRQPPPINVKDRIKDYNKRIDSEYSEFPEEAAKLKTLFAESLDGIPQVLEKVKPPAPPPPVAGPDQRNERAHLETAYSDWGERRFSPEFDHWLSTQNRETQQMLNSAYASDNIALLDAFTRDNPDWVPPQTPESFHSLRQAQFSPLFRGWAEGEGINPDVNVARMPDHHRDSILSRFKSDLGAVLSEKEQTLNKVTKLASRRNAQLQDRSPGSRRLGIKPGQKIDLDTEEGQRAYFQQLIAADPDL